MQSKKPTKAQRKYLKAMILFKELNEYFPNYVELAEFMSVSVNAAFEMLERLNRNKVIRLIKDKTGHVRSIEICGSVETQGEIQQSPRAKTDSRKGVCGAIAGYRAL